MASRVFEAWAVAECEHCGDEFYVTRTEGRTVEGEIFCDACEQFKSGHKAGYDEAVQDMKPRLIDRKFVWGDIIQDHVLGEYLIREYTDKDDEIGFHVYIDGIDQHMSYETLETAIVGAIAVKYDGANTQADTHFYRMIDVDNKYGDKDE